MTRKEVIEELGDMAKRIIRLDGTQLKQTISTTSAGNHAKKKYILALCDFQLDALNREVAMVEMSDPSDMGGE